MTVTYQDKTFLPYLSAEQIALRVRELAATINNDYAGKRPCFLILLNGAFVFAADLLRQISIDCEIHFLKFKSYSGTSSSGTINSLLPFPENLKGKDVIIVEDIIDTGRTVHYLCEQLQQESLNTLRIASLLIKPEAHERPIHTDYYGFSIPNDFVIGYGMDIDGWGRNLPDIYRLK